MGAGLILPSRQRGHGCRPGESSMPATSNPVQPVPPGSGPQNSLLFPAGALDMPELRALQWRAGRRARVAGTAVGMLMELRNPGPKPGV